MCQSAASLASISSTLELGTYLTISVFLQPFADVHGKLEAYNITLSALNATKNAVSFAEDNLAVVRERILIDVARKYGKDSAEYEVAGSIRNSERKPPMRAAEAASAVKVA